MNKTDWGGPVWVRWSCVELTYFTFILQSSVGTLEGHSEVGVYLASFAFLIRNI